MKVGEDEREENDKTVNALRLEANTTEIVANLTEGVANTTCVISNVIPEMRKKLNKLDWITVFNYATEFKPTEIIKLSDIRQLDIFSSDPAKAREVIHSMHRSGFFLSAKKEGIGKEGYILNSNVFLQ